MQENKRYRVTKICTALGKKLENQNECFALKKKKNLGWSVYKCTVLTVHNNATRTHRGHIKIPSVKLYLDMVRSNSVKADGSLAT